MNPHLHFVFELNGEVKNCMEYLTRLLLQCQSAALDELFGKGGECFQRYHTAQILLHSLAQHVSHSQDRALLIKCTYLGIANVQLILWQRIPLSIKKKN